jgi:hypothetical protein
MSVGCRRSTGCIARRLPHVARAGKTRPVMTEAQIGTGQRRLSASAAQALVIVKEPVTGTTGQLRGAPIHVFLDAPA